MLMNEIVTEKKTITTLEIAEMMGTEHWKILRKLDGITKKTGEHDKGYVEVLTDHNFVVSDYFITSTYKDASGKENKCYLVTKLGCDFLANKFTGEKGILFTAKYVKRFDEMEQEIKNPYNLPTTYKDALKQLLAQVEENEKLIAENETMKPKVEYHDDILKKQGLISTTIIAKDLGFSSAIKLNKLMHEAGIIFKNKRGTWCPYAEYEWLIEQGYCDYESYKDENAILCLKWTEKGRKWIVENHKKW